MQDKPTLFMSPGSHHARRVRLLIQEMDIDVEEQIIDVRPPGMGGENQGEAFLRLNPAGKVPVLQDGDFILAESNAIMIYLAERYGPTPLWPEDPQCRAKIQEWQFFQAAHISTAADGLLAENIVKPMMKLPEDPEAKAQLIASFHRWAQVLDQALADRPFLMGDALTCADLAVVPAFMYARAAQLPLAEHKALSAWIGHIHERPSWKETEPAER